MDDIRDDELRIIGRPPVGSAPVDSGKKKPKKRRAVWLIVGVAAFIALILSLIFIPNRKDAVSYVEEVYEQPSVLYKVAPEDRPPGTLGDYTDTTGKAYTELIEKTVNDIPLEIYIPHNSIPKLKIGPPDADDTTLVFAAQAADIRADNKKINGAFVLAGEPIAWNLSKKGYVAIIEGKVTVGVAENTGLFEESIEKKGYFFRQYGLVDNGTIVENEPKGKSIRKAICDRAGEIMIVFTSTPESFHDFSQALVDLQVDNAVYLVGSCYSYGFRRDYEGELTEFASESEGFYKNENYLIWYKEFSL